MATLHFLRTAKLLWDQKTLMGHPKRSEMFQVLAEKWPTLDVSDANCYDRFRFICFAVVSIVGLVTCSVCSGIVSSYFSQNNFKTNHIQICFHTFARLRVTSSLSETAKRNNFSMTTALLVQVKHTRKSNFIYKNCRHHFPSFSWFSR